MYRRTEKTETGIIDKKTELVDSGKRTMFDTGAMREIIVGKGRFDLIPFDALGNIIQDPVYVFIGEYMKTSEVTNLEQCLSCALNTPLSNYGNNSNRTQGQAE